MSSSQWPTQWPVEDGIQNNLQQQYPQTELGIDSMSGQVQDHNTLLHLTLSQPTSNQTQAPQRSSSLLLDVPTTMGAQEYGLPGVSQDLTHLSSEMDGYSTFVPAAHQQWASVPAQSLPSHLGLGDAKSFASMLRQESNQQQQHHPFAHTAGGLSSHSPSVQGLSQGVFHTQSHAVAPSGVAAPSHDFASNSMTQSPLSFAEHEVHHNHSTSGTTGWTSMEADSRSSSAASWPTSQSTDRDSLNQDLHFEDRYGQDGGRRTEPAPQLFAYSGAAASSAALSSSQAFPPHQPWRQVDPQLPLMPVIASPAVTADPSHSDQRRTSLASIFPEDMEEDADGSLVPSAESQARRKDRYNRRQGVTCDQCRDKHLRCDLADRSPDAPGPGRPRSAGASSSSAACSRCVEKGYTCTKTNAPPSRRYPRPSRTGKRIEQARLMHGSVAADAAKRRAGSGSDLSRRASSGMVLDVALNSPENNLAGSLLSSAATLRLLTCYFATAHIQIPVIDFASFSSRYNLAAGDMRKMSLMLNGGSPLENIPSIPMHLPPGMTLVWPTTGDSTVSTPGTTETLIASMVAWAARFSDMPLVFGSQSSTLGLDPSGSMTSNPLFRSRPGQGSGITEAEDSENSADEQQQEYSDLPPAKRPKRKQGVACDTCRLRRVRCDLMERKDGMPCTRCQDKKIVCTDEYIQQKRRDNEAKLRKEREKLRKQLGSAGSSGGEASHAFFDTTNPAQLGDNPDPLAWTDMSGVPAIVSNDQHPARYGLARQGFCQEMLTRAVVLLHKHKLMYRPSVEAVQVMVLLIHLFDLVDPAFSAQMSAACASHMRALGLQSVDEVDENDTKSVENLFNLMQDKRVWCTAWTRDAIACCVHRKAPKFFEDTPIKIRGSFTSSPAGNRPAPELTPAMGLSFSVMALMQIGVLGRFVTKHIDNITIADHPPPQERFPMLPSAADNAKLSRACHAAWKSNDALIDFFDRCTLKSWHQMEALKIHQPKVWTAAVKVSSAMVTLSIFRILGERQRLNAAYLQAVSEAHGPHAIAAEDIVQSQALRNLFEQSRQKTLTICRRVARLVQQMHRRPSLTFQTGGILLKQLFAVAQFIARSPTATDADQSSAVEPFLSVSSGGGSGSQMSSSGEWDSRQRQNLATTGTFIPTVRPEPPSSPSELYGLAVAYDAPLPRFTAEAKHAEVEACLLALEQIGFAWPVEAEVQSIKALMQSERANTFGMGLTL